MQVYDAHGSLIGSAGYESTFDILPRDVLEQFNTGTAGGYLRVNPNGGLILGRKLFRFAPTLSEKGYIMICLSPQLLRGEILADISFGSGAITFFSSADGALFFPDDAAENETLAGEAAQLTDGSERTFSLNSRQYLLTSCVSDVYGFRFFVAIPYSEIYGRMQGVLKTLILVAAGLFVISFLAMLLVYASIMQPIQQMMKHCGRNLSALSQPLSDHSPDELGVLARTLDNLIARLCDMAEQQKKNEERKRELELSALQYQINPHFLFNTLNTFKWIADLNGVPALHDGISSLCTLLKSTLLGKKDMHPLSE
ncbi:MAG: histidine kinase [Clostridia bacterium]|nr:histidine kinase [Clostridia bacterium]